MTHRILLAADDSPDALAAARFSVGLAAELGAVLRVLNVVPALTGVGEGATRDGWDPTSPPVLARVAALAERRGVTVVTDLLVGEVAETILDVAATWDADLVVLGRSGRPGGWGYVGERTRHVLELASQPVVVVPGPPPRR
jgi:nucleotide-binding universal stress UspA family protein